MICATATLDRTISIKTMKASFAAARPMRSVGRSGLSESIVRDTITAMAAPKRTRPGEKPVSKIHIANRERVSSGKGKRRRRIARSTAAARRRPLRHTGLREEEQKYELQELRRIGNAVVGVKKERRDE